MRAAAAAATALARRVAGGEAAGGLALLAHGIPARPSLAVLAAPASSTRRPFSTSTPSAADSGGDVPKASWLPAWARARLPAALGGDPDGADLTLDAWAVQIKRARQLAAAGQAIGGAARASADPHAQGNLRLYEAIVATMAPAHRADPATFDPAARRAVAEAAGVSPAQVDDCMAKYEGTRRLMRLLADRRAAGLAMPTSVEELEGMMGEWQARKGGGVGGAAASGACPFEGRAAPGRNAVCGRTGKKWKNCCGGK